MTATELIRNLRSMGNLHDLKTSLLYIAVHADEVKLRDGNRLLDQSDFTAFLIELANAAEALETPTPINSELHPERKRQWP